ncbi:quercetin-dioxygenase [Diplodia corticola]|uniref:Quercetin-dioxygenase n=1 Tax=Diplodia corticola TaxID=236234 RepID=A0A1J9R5I5_9PEZI|nr:quercetin-dioxygenase [Diplodia corticola]OJD35817.1 quercetin-dioxygenase [Diplodia corticola]
MSKVVSFNAADKQTSNIPSSKILLATLAALIAIALALFTPLRSFVPSRLHPRISALRTMATTTTTTAPSGNTKAFGPAAPPSTMKLTRRPWNERGHADHGWLYTYHTFSFASYWSADHEAFGPLRVINEDRVAPGTGFGAHSHAEFLIWSYVVGGELEHKDSMGNLERLRRGDVQFTSAGTGIRHSEFNRNTDAEVHFLQIWARPAVRGLTPAYTTRTFPDELKVNRLCRVMESVGRHGGGDGESEPIPLHADLSMSASLLEPGVKVRHRLVADGERKVYLHVVMAGREQPKEGGAAIRVGDKVLREGDGAYVEGLKGPGEVVVESVGDKRAEFLLFDMEP